MSQNAIQALQGQPFTITLRDNSGTNYRWALASMPEGVVLASVNSAPVSKWHEHEHVKSVAVDTTFTFIAVDYAVVEKSEVVFNLIEWGNIAKATDKVVFDVIIIPYNEKQGLHGFVRYSENAAAYNVPPYGYSGPLGEIIKYGYPQCVKYGFYGCEGWTPALVAYGHPDCDQSIRAKYGYQGCAPYVIDKYGYQGCEPSIIVKYGYKGCESSTVVKYGYLGCEPSPAVEYGYPDCEPSSAIMKYGYQGCAPYVIEKYGYQGCEPSIIVKYGYNGCEDSIIVKYGFNGCEPSVNTLYGYFGCK